MSGPPVAVGQRARKTLFFPARGVFCPRVSWTYEGTVAKVLDLEENARRNGCSIARARSYRGEYHIRLEDVLVTPDPQTPLQQPQRQEVVTLTGDGSWEVLG